MADEYGREAPSSEAAPHITVADLKFLVDNKVALRWQPPEMHEQFLKEGLKSGDAYSLADVREWDPPSVQKAADFEKGLRAIVERMVYFNLGSLMPGGRGGVLMLCKNVENADTPVTDKDNDYKKGPIFPVGMRDEWRPDQLIGALTIKAETAQDLGYNGISSGDARQDKAVLDRLFDYQADQLIKKIHEARESSPDYRARLEAAAPERDNKGGGPGHSWEKMESSQHGFVMRMDATAFDATDRSEMLDTLRLKGIEAQVVHSNTFGKDYIQVSGSGPLAKLEQELGGGRPSAPPVPPAVSHDHSDVPHVRSEVSQGHSAFAKLNAPKMR